MKTEDMAYLLGMTKNANQFTDWFNRMYPESENATAINHWNPAWHTVNALRGANRLGNRGINFVVDAIGENSNNANDQITNKGTADTRKATADIKRRYGNIQAGRKEQDDGYVAAMQNNPMTTGAVGGGVLGAGIGAMGWGMPGAIGGGVLGAGAGALAGHLLKTTPKGTT